MLDKLPVGTLILASIESTSQTLLTIGIGYLSARSGFLNDKTQKGLQKLTINVLTPALLFANVGAQIDLQKLIALWAVPAFYVGYLCIGFIIAVIAGKICKFDWTAIKFVAAGVIFQNTTSLPIALIQSIASTRAITLLMKEDDTPGAATARGISFILIASLLSNLFRYSVGTWLFNDSDAKQANESDTEDSDLLDTTPLLSSTPRRRKITGMAVSGWHRAREIFNPPLLAAIVALVVGITPPLKHLFFSQDGVFYSSLTATIRQLGQACIPMVMITLGAELYTLPRDTSPSTKEMVTAIIILKMLVMPILGGAAVLSLRQWVTDDPMLLFVLILLAASPTAINLMTISQMTRRYESETATVLFYSYLVAAFTLTIAVSTILLIFEYKL
ncbi:auxin efflux carrier [Umbelopsis sp. AD052]|nr:auxin efflux carrier [Umbelopsis sp. AD052]